MSALRTLCAAFVVIAGTFALASRATGSCAALPDGMESSLKVAPIAFVGTVKATRNNGRIATFDVEEIWKGPNVADPIEVSGGPGDPNAITSVDRTWEIGTRYLVLPTADAAGELTDSACSSTSVYKPEFDALRPASAHPPQGPPTSGVPGATPIAAIFLVILVLGSIGGFFLYRARPPV